MAQKVLGIDLGSHSVKLVVISAGLRRTQVLQSFEQVVKAPALPEVAASPSSAAASPSDGRSENEAEPDKAKSEKEAQHQREVEALLDASIDAAVALMRQHDFMHMRVAISIPSEWCSYRTLELPFSDAKRIAQTLEFEIEGQFPHPIEDLIYDHLKVHAAKELGNPKGSRALVVAAERYLVERIARRFHTEVRAEIKSITAGTIALAQSLAKPKVVSRKKKGGGEAGRDGDQASLVVDIGHRSTQLLAIGPRGPLAARSVRKGGEILTRRIASSYQLDWDVAESAKHRDAFLPAPELQLNEAQRAASDLVERSFMPLAREIEHTCRWLKSELGVNVIELELCGGGSLVDGLDEWLTRRVGIDVVRAMPMGTLALVPSDGGQSGGWDRNLVALGAALGVARRPLVQLYDPDGGAEEGAWLIERIGSLSLIGALVLGFAAIDTVVKMQARDKEVVFYSEQLEKLSEPIFGESLNTEHEIRSALGGEEEGTASNRLPKRGAFEVFAAITKVAKPSDADEAKAAAQANPGVAPLDPIFDPSNPNRPPGYESLPIDPRTGKPYVPPGGGPLPFPLPPPGVAGPADTTGQPEVLAPVELSAGIVTDDALVFSVLDIREVKMELKMTATRATAQDRLAIRLEALGCIDKVTKGKIRDQNDRKRFEMVIDHHCFTADKLKVEEPEKPENENADSDVADEVSDKEGDE